MFKKTKCPPVLQWQMYEGKDINSLSQLSFTMERLFVSRLIKQVS